MALITALLLLMIITILGLSMFRSFPTQEKIAGNVREKERALHAANSAQEYAEWWLMQNNNIAIGDVVCGAGTPLINANLNVNVGQICSNPLYTLLPTGTVTDVASQVPWTVGGVPIGVQYLPNGMAVTGNPIVTAGDSTYASTPVFYIADLGAAGDGQGEAYQIDAYAYAGSTSTLAVVESVYEVAQGVVNRTGE
ncbi:MAG: PilX N-terminal domain-containing pilus assembly protein [Steroidobacteraceae bacterium]